MSKESKLSRREFIKDAAIGAAAVAGAGVLGTAPAQAQGSCQTPWLPAKWDKEADIVVVGTGLAGLAAAIAATDAGANVLVLEKLSQAYEGGSSRVAGQWIVAPVDMTKNPPAPMIAEGAAYWKAMACGTMDDAVYTAKAQGFYDSIAWVKKLGGNLGTWPAAPSHAGPGDKYIQAFVIAADGAPVQPNGFPVGTTGDSRMWKVFRNAATSRKINVLYETPVTDLIQNGITHEILGVKATSNGATINIKANKGVILACGSIEFAPDLQKQYFPFWPVYGNGSPGNTGDGIKMAQKAGADLWHMNALLMSGPNIFRIPGTELGSTTKGGVMGTTSLSAPGIRVDKFGNRFNMGNAVNGPVGGFGNETNAVGIMDNKSLDFNSIPCWAIFDEAMRKKGPLMTASAPSSEPGKGGMSGWFKMFSGYSWSADNSEEVKKGWILSGKTLAELADAIAKDPDNVTPLTGKAAMTGKQLQATVDAYNADCKNKADAQFLTDPATLASLGDGPYYAVKLWPTYDHAGTGAGPKHNLKCQVVDPSGQPIPRLYAAGELGGFYYVWCTGGEHLAECVWSGRVAGQSSAAEKPWAAT